MGSETSTRSETGRVATSHDPALPSLRRFHAHHEPPTPHTIPKVKDRTTLTNIDLEKRYELALKGLEDGTYDTLAKAVQAHDLRKSSLGHRRNGRHSQQVAYHDQQIFTLTAEKAIVCWILKLDNYGMLPRVDYLTDAVMELVKNEKSRQVQVRS